MFKIVANNGTGLNIVESVVVAIRVRFKGRFQAKVPVEVVTAAGIRELYTAPLVFAAGALWAGRFKVAKGITQAPASATRTSNRVSFSILFMVQYLQSRPFGRSF